MYKIIKDNKVIDVVRIPRFVNFLASGHIAITDKASAQGIASSDDKIIYRIDSTAPSNFELVTIEAISEEELNRLSSLLSSNKEIIADDSILATAKRSTLNRLSNICKSKITAGFSVTLSDGEKYSFKLTTEDQLNLMLMENQLLSGSETFIYHATNQPCKIFSREDVIKVLQAFKHCVLYHTTYFNAAKQYINSLTDLEKINLFTYGTDVSNTVDNVVIKQILKNGGTVE